MVKGVEAQLVQKRCHRYLRVHCDGVAKRQRAVGSQLTQETVGQRLYGVVPFLLGFGLAAECDDRALDHRRSRLAPIVRFVTVLAFAVGFYAGGGLVLWPDI